MRIDLLLCRLRFAKTRSVAQRLLASSRMRCNGVHVDRPSHPVKPGDVLTFASGNRILIVEILRLPERRGPATEARTHYRALDRTGESAVAAAVNSTRFEDSGT